MLPSSSYHRHRLNGDSVARLLLFAAAATVTALTHVDHATAQILHRTFFNQNTQFCNVGVNYASYNGGCKTYPMVGGNSHATTCDASDNWTVNVYTSYDCSGSATCTFSGSGSNCNPSFCGNNVVRVTCGYSICSSGTKCYNGGVCSTTDNSNFQCACPWPYYGSTCGNIILCSQQQPCQNGGTCSNPLGFGGIVLDTVCTCPSGWWGDQCELVSSCTSSTCANGGTCTDTAPGTTSCQCPTGFTGPTCAQNINDCSSSPCQNGGTCNDGIDSYTCTCPAGITGPTCATDIDECLASPCANGGTCLNAVGDFICTCVAPNTGKTCSNAGSRTATAVLDAVVLAVVVAACTMLF